MSELLIAFIPTIVIGTATVLVALISTIKNIIKELRE